MTVVMALAAGCLLLDWLVGSLDSTDHCWLRYEGESDECMGWCRTGLKIAEETAPVAEDNTCLEGGSRDMGIGLGGIP